MSRIGRAPIAVPEKVTITQNGNIVTVKGPKGELTREFAADMIIEVADNTITVKRPTDNKEHRALHGLTRTLLNNMVVGVTEGFSKTLEINGVGYRAQMQGKTLVLSLGYSHPVEYTAVEGITLEVPAPNQIIVKGANKEVVGETAAKIREYRMPEPYKGKGIKYVDEVIRRKEGKAGGKKK